MAKRNYKQGEQAKNPQDVSEWYEKYICWLLHQSGLSVQHEPCIRGKTPDLYVTQLGGPGIIIECLVKLNEHDHEKELIEKGLYSCGEEVKCLHANLYSRVEEKATKYRELVNGEPYIIAIYDMSCMNFPKTAVDLAYSAYAPYITFSSDTNKVIDSGYSDQWSTPERSASLFRLYPHLSGLIYSRWEREHYYLPNPVANAPVPADSFPFAHVPDGPDDQALPEPKWKEPALPISNDYPRPPNTWWGQVDRLRNVCNGLMEHRRYNSPN